GEHLLDENVGQDRAEQAVEDDCLGEGESEPLDSLELAPKLRLASDGLDHRAEDDADTDTGSGCAEPDAEPGADCLTGLRDVAGRCGEDAEHFVSSLVLRLDGRADV